jgi:hypothetical protein
MALTVKKGGASVSSEPAPVKRGPGRPPGSKNKPKEEPKLDLSEFDDLGDLESEEAPLFSQDDAEGLGMTDEEVREVLTAGEAVSFAGIEGEVLSSIAEKLDNLETLIKGQSDSGTKSIEMITQGLNALVAKVEDLSQAVSNLAGLIGKNGTATPAPPEASPQQSPEVEKILAAVKGLPQGKVYPAGPFIQRLAAKLDVSQDAVKRALEGKYLQGDYVRT